MTDGEKFTGAVAKAIKTHKKAAGIDSIRQNYKGSGSHAADRQLYIRFNNGALIDIWLYTIEVHYGGVVIRKPNGQSTMPKSLRYDVGDKTPQEVASGVIADLVEWSTS